MDRLRAIQDCMQLWPVLAIFLGSLVYEKAVQEWVSLNLAIATLQME